MTKPDIQVETGHYLGWFVRGFGGVLVLLERWSESGQPINEHWQREIIALYMRLEAVIKRFQK